MMTRLGVVIGWLLVSHALLAGLYWGLLQVPESTAWMLGLSALLVLVMAAGAAASQTGATAAWHPALPVRRGLAAGARRAAWFLPAADVFAAGWWATAWLHTGHLEARGAIDAVLMVRAGWADTAWVHRGIDYTLFALRWGVTLSLSVAVLAAGVFAGGRGVLNGRWLGRGLRPTAMLLTLACVVVFVWLPWQAVYWRPAGLAASAEPAFVAAKLAAVALVASLGWALILGAGARGAGIDADDSSIGHRPSSIT